MNNSINLTLDEQFDKDCKVIKLKYEYPGYTGEEKWAIITGLTEEELNEKYAEKTASLRPFIVLDLAFGKARTKFINNENKHYMRGVRSIEPFDYDDELLTAHHPELVVDSFEESFLRNETCQKVRSALATLQDVQKERVIKYFFDGKSTHEIAQEEVPERYSYLRRWQKCSKNVIRKFKNTRNCSVTSSKISTSYSVMQMADRWRAKSSPVHCRN